MDDHPHSAALESGLRWLYETEQPDGALISHHGVLVDAEPDRSLYFIPRGWDGYPVVVLEVPDRLRKSGPGGRPANPLRVGELEELAEWLAGRGRAVVKTWNGHPADTGSVALVETAHPSLLAAVERYSTGCPDHPREGVFCGCGWYGRGRDLIVNPGGLVPETP